MAKKNNAPKGQPSINNRANWYTDISYIDPALKNNLWFSEMIWFAKRNAVLFLDPKRAEAYRATDRLDLNERVYRQMVDPITPMDGGGDAAYFAADFKANPVYIHLKNIVKADIQRTAKELEVNLTDKYAKTRKMRDNYRLIYQKAFRELINEYAPMVGLSPISDKQDPYKWVANLVNNQKKKEQSKNKEVEEVDLKLEGQQPDTIDSFVDLIKNQVSDSQDLALYNEYIYKGDYEIAFELGIKYYLINQNKWLERWSDEFLDDLMHFNKCCGEWYTDEITGRPIVERFVPEKLFVSPFKRKDGEDLMYYFIEYDITFADFVRTMGKNLEPQKLKDVFEYNKMQGSRHNLVWDNLNPEGFSRERDNAKIRVGKFSCLTQDYEVNMDDYTANYPRATMNNDLSWTSKEGINPPNNTKHYNVWYSCYYLPPTTSSLSNANFAWQSQFIFDIKKNQDQFRYGADGRYSKSPLVIYDNSTQASFTDIVQEYMPKIHHAWHKVQNCLINDVDAIALSDEFLGSLLSAVDEDNKIGTYDESKDTGGNGRDAALQQWKMIKQGNIGFLKMTDKNGMPVGDPSKYVVPIKNGQLERAEKYLGMIALLYNQMTQSLAMSDAAEGMEIKPRTPVAGIQESIKSSKNAQWFIQLGYEAFLKMYAERIVKYILTIAQERKEYGYEKRWQEFMDIVGEANGLMVEGIEDIPAESIGMTVNYVDNTAKKDLVSQICIEKMKTGEIDEDYLYLLMGVDNWKYMFVLLRMGIKKRKLERQQEQQIQQGYVMEQKQMDLKIAQALNADKTAGKDQNIKTQGAVDAQIEQMQGQQKHQSQVALKQQIKDNKIEEQNNASNLEQQKALTV